MLYNELEDIRLPNTCNKMETRHKGAQKISKHDHGRLLDESPFWILLEMKTKSWIVQEARESEGEQSMDDDNSSDSKPSES
jgi:hypothetical protein